MAILRALGLLGLFGINAFAQIDSSILDGAKFCDDTCKQMALDAAAWERSQHASEPLDAFYNAPSEFGPETPAGEVLRIEQHTNLTTYTVPSGLTMSRILYTSENLNGSVVLASAYALWPYEVYDYASEDGGYSTAETPKYPLVAWGHGTSGLFQRCAPSNYKALQYHFLSVFPIALEGFAIVAPDYAGLGASAFTDGSKQLHGYLSPPSQANDLAFAIQAIRKAFPDRFEPEGPFGVAGHSQGGFTAWGFAQRQVQKPIPGYRGTVTISPPIDNIKSLRQTVQAAVNGLPVPAAAFGFLPLFINGITALYPEFNFFGLSEKLVDRLNNVVRPLELCLPSTNLLFAGFPVEEYLSAPKWINRTEVLTLQETTKVSRVPFAGPLHVVLGGQDVVTPEIVTAAINDTCAMPENAGQHLEYLQLDATGHFGVISASRNRWWSWLKDRILDKPLKTPGCGQKTILKGIDTNYTSFVGAFPPNFLVEGVSQQDEWKLAL